MARCLSFWARLSLFSFQRPVGKVFLRGALTGPCYHFNSNIEKRKVVGPGTPIGVSLLCHGWGLGGPWYLHGGAMIGAGKSVVKGTWKKKQNIIADREQSSGLMQYQDTYFPVLVKEDRTIALSAFTFPELGWVVKVVLQGCRRSHACSGSKKKKKKKPPKPLIFSEVDNVQRVICAPVIYFFCESKILGPVIPDSVNETELFSPLSLMKQRWRLWLEQATVRHQR